MFDRFLMDFGTILEAKIEPKSIKKTCWKNDEKMMTTKMAIKSHREEEGGGVNHSSKTRLPEYLIT